MATAISQCRLKRGQTWVVVWRGSQGAVRGAKAYIELGHYATPCPVEAAVARDPEGFEYLLLLRRRQEEEP